MFFEITHKTTYTYSRPIFLGLHHLRIRPRCDGVQTVTYFESTVEPCPADRRTESISTATSSRMFGFKG